MDESSNYVASLLPFSGIASRLGTAFLIQYLGSKHRVMSLMKCLSKGSAQYVQDSEHMLDQFWLIGNPVKFSSDWLAEKLDKYKPVESMSPLPETKVVPPDYRI